MRDLIEMEDGILVEVEASDPRGRQEDSLEPSARGMGDATVESKVGKRLSDALGQLAPIVKGVNDAIEALVHKPESVTVEFGVKFSAKADVIIAKADSEANLKICLKWKSAGTATDTAKEAD